MVGGGSRGMAGDGRPGSKVAGPDRPVKPQVPAGYGFAAIIVASSAGCIGRHRLSAIPDEHVYIGGELAQSRRLPKRDRRFQGLLIFTRWRATRLDRGPACEAVPDPDRGNP